MATLLTNHRGVIIIPPISNEGQILTLLKSYWFGTISQLTTVTQETEKKPSGTLGKRNLKPSVTTQVNEVKDLKVLSNGGVHSVADQCSCFGNLYVYLD